MCQSLQNNRSTVAPSAQAWTTTLVPCSCILFKLSPLVCPSSQSQQRGRTQGMIKRGRLPLFLIYRGEKNVHALVLLIREVLFDVVAFIGLEMPISHSTTNLWSENTILLHTCLKIKWEKQNVIKIHAEQQQYLVGNSNWFFLCK